MYKSFLIFTLFFSFALTFGQEPVTAIQIIEKVITSKNDNSFDFQALAYQKLLISADPNKVQGKIDTIYKFKKGKKILKEIDSSDFTFKKYILKQHIYQTEKLSRYYNQNNKTKEYILATKMAGFEEPLYEFFSLRLAPFNLYEDKFVLVEKKFINPVSTSGLHKYNFKIEDTISIQNREVYKISFKPKKNRKFNRLNGIIYVDCKNFAIARLQLLDEGVLKVLSQHEFDFNLEASKWLPSKTKLSIKKGKSNSPIKILGETISFEDANASLNPKNRKYASDFIEVNLNTKYFDFKVDKLEKRNMYEDIIINNDAFKKRENLWYTHLNDTIDLRSNPTYVSVDSLMDKRRLENKIRIGKKVIKGYYPVYFFDFDLRYLFRLNNYEGIRVGLGGVTNERLSKKYKIEGYLAYGTKDGQFKGMVSNSFRLHKKTESWLGLSYKDDVAEIANTSFEIDKRRYKFYDPRPFNISTFYNHETWKFFIESKMIPKSEMLINLNNSFVEPKFNYEYNLNGKSYTDFYISMLMFSLQWNPFSKYMQTPSGKIEYEKMFPKFSFQFAKTLNNVAHNTFNFGSLNLRFDYQHKFNSNHKIMFLAETQYTFGNAPLTHLYNHSPNNLTRDKILQRITFAGNDSFETMYFNEFFSNKHLFLQLKHQLPRIELSRQVKPLLSFVSRYGVGSLIHKERHAGIEFKTLEKGYQESGFELNQIYKGLGFVFFYRHGANHLPSLEDNISIKLSLQFNLGLNN